MKTSTITNDNVTEILNKIVDFTDRRNTVITDNILNVNSDNYTPRDLDAKGFAELMASALSEHLINDRIVLVDNENFKFGNDGFFQAEPVTDQQALELKQADSREYLNYQLKKLAENRLNKKVACQLIKQKQQNYSKMSI